MTSDSAFSPPVGHRYYLQKGKRMWSASTGVVGSVTQLEVVCPSEHSARDEDYQEWLDDIFEDLEEIGFTKLEVVTHLGPNKIQRHLYLVK